MSDRNNTETVRVAAYRSLHPVHKLIVDILVIAGGHCSVKNLVACLRELSVDRCPESGRVCNILNIQPVLHDLAKKELLIKSRSGLFCPESIQQIIVHTVLLRDDFPSIAETVKAQLFVQSRTGAMSFTTYRQLLSALLLELFTATSLDVIYKIHYLINNEPFADRPINDTPYSRVLGEPFSPEIVEKMYPDIRMFVLEQIFMEKVASLESFAELQKYILAAFKEPDFSSSYLFRYIIYSYFLSGAFGKIRAFMEAQQKKLSSQMRNHLGWLECISGNYQQALEFFDRSVQEFKTKSGRKKGYLQGYPAIFHLLTLLATNNSQRLQEALDWIEVADKKTESFVPVLQIIKPVFEKQLGLPPTPYFSFFRSEIYEGDALLYFIITLFLFWVKPVKARENIPVLRSMRDKALKNGYTWLAAEISSLLAALGYQKSSNTELAAKLHASCHSKSLLTLLKKQQKWEKTLNALLTISTGDGTDKPVSSEQRLVWLIAYSEKYNHCSITPKMQKMSVKGNWTKGRPVGLQNLYKNHIDMKGLTEQDRRVCRAIKEEYYQSSWHYGKREYEIDESIALPALTGHPLLFLASSPGVSVELISAEPEIWVAEEKGKLRLSMSPFPGKQTDDVAVFKDTPARFKVIRFTDKHREIARFLGKKGLSVPKVGRDKAQEVVDSLSSLVPVQSDLAMAAGTETIEGDPLSHAHIIPFHDGIQVELLVKPSGAKGSSFRPGRGGKTVLTEIDGKRIQAVRDFKEEKKRYNLLLRSCPTLQRIEPLEDIWQLEDPEDALELLLELKECGDDVIIEWPQGEKMAVRRAVAGNEFAISIKKDRDWFKASGRLQIDDDLSLDLRRLLDLMDQATGRFIPLDDGTFLTITQQLRKRLDELQAFSQGHGRGVRFSPLAGFALEEFADEVGNLKSDKAWKEHCKKLHEVIRPQVPSTLQADLRDYQVEGFNWLAQLSHWGMGACLADDMGLGKTVQALAAILLKAGQGPSLVIAPLSVTSNWLDEAARFAPTLNVIAFGPGDRKEVMNSLQPFDLLVVSYGLLPLESELLSGVAWQTVVLDEAQAIKNMQTKRSKAAMELQAESRIITTGTPVENHLGELWTLFKFLNPGLLGAYKQFNVKFALPIERDQDSEARNRLRKLIRPFILRRMKSDVLQELPAKTEVTLEVEMSRQEQLLYETQRLKSLETLEECEDDETPQHLRILTEIMKLRRLCCNPRLLLPETDITSSKLKVFADTVEELLSNNHKALVFSQFVGHLALIREYLDRKRISYQYLDGSTSLKKRRQRINCFQNGEGDLFLISLKAGGSGLNLTAADYVIHMDPWWNPAVEDQASDRAHRIGQERPVTVYRLVMKGSIEEQIMELHKQKRDLANSLLEGTDSAGKVTAEELLGLLRG